MINLAKLTEKISLYRLAKAMKIPVVTAYSWVRSGKIPSWRANDIVVACGKLGIDISDCMEGGDE